MYYLSLEPWMQRAGSNTQLYQLIRIAGDSLDFTAYTVTGETYDAFTLVKQEGERPNVFLDRAPENVPERMDIPERYRSRMSEEELEVYRNRFEAYEARKRND
jgi:hypothetical protein